MAMTIIAGSESRPANPTRRQLRRIAERCKPLKPTMKETLHIVKTSEFEKELWDDGLFVFDSSALLNFYEYSESSRKEIYKTIFKKINDRLWMTNQTEFEYLKNRESVLLKPKKLYDELLENHFEIKQFKSFQNQYQQLKNRTKKDDKHPHIKENFFKDFDIHLVSFETQLQKFSEKLKLQVEKKKKEIEKIKEKDTVQIALNKYFKTGDGFSYDQITEIAKEGEFRYRNSIPPGYEDEREKIGFQIYGDLIIWKQILNLAKEYKKPIILIIDDLKIDWCYKNIRDKNIIDSPREELIKEMLDVGGVKFWSYSSTQFLQKSNELLGSLITEDIISDVKSSNQYNLSSIVEKLVFEWAVEYYGDEGDVTYVGDNKDFGVDLLVSIDSFRIGVEIKYYPSFRLQSIKNLTERLIPRFVERGYYDNFDEMMIIIACENEELAMKMQSSKSEYEKSTKTPIFVLIGYINEGKKFELIAE